MAKWSTEQLVFVTKAYISQGNSIVLAQRSFKKNFNMLTSPTKKVIYRAVKNFSSTGNLEKKKPGRSLTTATTTEKVEEAKQIIENNPKVSVRRLAQQLGTSTGSAHTILTKKLKLFPYKIQICQKLKEGDYECRVRFCVWLKEKLNEDANFLGRLIMSDEAHFSLNGCVNRQNLRFWATENPKETMEVPLHSLRVTVWCALTETSIIGPFFFETPDGQTTTVNGERYGAMLREYFIPEADNMDLVNPFFQQDGATCHTTRVNMTILRERFPRQVISRFGDVEWPARSPDLSPLDFFLWGYLKGRVYRENPTTLDQLKEAIRTEIRLISSEMTAEVMKNMRKRVDFCIASNGRHLKDIIFKK